MSPPSKPHPEAFWPTIKQAIDKGANTNPDNEAITPQCPICMEPLPVKSFPAHGELDAEVLLCGHVLCKPCRKQYDKSNPRGRCPVCRTTLTCSRCKLNAIPIPIPKNGEESSLAPTTLPEGTQGYLCPDCVATVEFHRDVENGEWPHNLDDMEPGFISFFYHVVDDIEKNGDVATEGRVQEAISDTIVQEFANMMTSRRCVTLGRGNTLRQTNPWYAENNEHQENRRVGVIQNGSSPSTDSDSDSDSGGVARTLGVLLDESDAILSELERLTDSAQPDAVNMPSDVQDGIALLVAATQTSEPARRESGRSMLEEDTDHDLSWFTSTYRQRVRNTVPTAAESESAPETAEPPTPVNSITSAAEGLPTNSMFSPNREPPRPRPNRRAERAERAERAARAAQRGMQVPASGSRFATPSAASQTTTSAQDREAQVSTFQGALGSRIELVEREGIALPPTSGAARLFAPGNLPDRNDFVLYPDNLLRLGESIGVRPPRLADYLATGESSNPASSASYSSMDLDDSDEDMLSSDQHVSER
ncbi:hypothetical protein FGADI_12823 [Fusarium gaditjirri]|uniref:RING-type domain-containing protein n=1 Tax=Fusarium gaditjirri TaxID=282569 RepID=A0A8H4SRD2_9HYPO|nr:hypothetical protein FGADI_12823 [Fusarium gaditjirri]